MPRHGGLEGRSPTVEADARQVAMVLIAVAILISLPMLAKPPVIDEESYLWLGQAIGLGRPYDWARAWPPWGEDGFIYAHPPLFLWWMGLWSRLSMPLPMLRILAGGPWIVLLAASGGWLATRTTRHPYLAGILWLCSPVAMLGLQNSLMIDLPVVALGTLGIAAWREGWHQRKTAYFLLAGLALGLGIGMKYPVAFLLPLLLAHTAARWKAREQIGGALLGLGLAFGIWFGIEGALYAMYGRLHLWEVWQRRAEIPSGPFFGRALGVIIRMGLVALPLVLFRTLPLSWAGGLLLSLIGLIFLHPVLFSVSDGLLLLFCGSMGGAVLIRAGVAMINAHTRRRKGDRDDAILLGGWVLTVALSVIAFHNFASARYLFPAALPAALLLTRSAEEVPGGKNILRGSILLTATLATFLAIADLRFAWASEQVAEDAVSKAKKISKEAGVFEGEWTFRWVMEKQGWRHREPGEVLAPGSLLIVADNAASDRQDLENMEPVGRMDAADHFLLRVVEIESGVGLYAETLGILPFGFSRTPLEGATIFQQK